jgi:ankyrin repeat protein
MRFRAYLFISVFVLEIGILHAQEEMTIDEQLIIASDKGDSLTVQKLIKMGAAVNATTYEGVTPLMFASMNGNNSIVRYLLEQGAKPDKQASDGNTALILAIGSGQIETVEILLRKGANINLNDRQEVSPLMHAIMVDSFYMPDMLLYYGADPEHKDLTGKNALMIASQLGSYEIAIKLLEAGLDVNEKDNEGNTPLHYATSEGRIEMMDLLIVNGADLEIKNNSGFTPLATAVALNNYKAVLNLIGYGTDVNTRISNSLNPLTVAVSRRGNPTSDSIRELLINNEADLLNRPNFDRFVTGFSYVFNSADRNTGVMMGFHDSRFGFLPSICYSLRPQAARILDKTNETTFYQYWERRHYIALSLDKDFFTQNLGRNFRTGASAGLSGVFTFGSYKGTSAHPDPHFIVAPDIGAFIQYGNIRVTFGYEFMNLGLRDFESDWFSISVRFLMITKRGKVSVP